MKKVLLIMLSTISISFINVFAHDAPDPIPVKCIITDTKVLSDIKVGTSGLKGNNCYVDDHDPNFKEKKDIYRNCGASIILNYTKGSIDLSKRHLDSGFFFDMEVNIKFKDGINQTQIVRAMTINPAINILGLSKDVTYHLYNKEKPNIKCNIL